MQLSQTNSSLGSVIDSVKSKIAWAGEFLANGAHAQQTLPSQHRLRAAGGMFLGWVTGDKLRDYIFGITQKSEGEYVEIPREDVPAPLRFLHKTIDWNPHSDAPEDQYKKILYQCIPMVTAGLGTVAGSMSAFGPVGPLSGQLGANGREGMFKKYTAAKSLTLPEADMSAQYAQAKTFRILTAMFGGFSAASMLNIVYGIMLNSAFVLAIGSRAFGFGGGLGMSNLGPARAADALVKGVGPYVKAFENGDKQALEQFATLFEKRVLEPLFKNDLKNPAEQEKVRKIIQGWVENSYKKHSNLKAAELQTAVANDIQAKIGTLNRKNLKELGLNIENATLGEALPFSRRLHDFLENIGVVSKEKTKTSYMERVLRHPDNATATGFAMGGA